MTAAGADHPSAGVPTYRGEIDPADLGRTLTHEHLFVLTPDLDHEYPHPEWDPDAAVSRAVEMLRVLWDLGVRTIVDLTVPGLGRCTELVARVAEQARVNIVAATGWYTDDALPLFFRTHGPDRLVGGPDPLGEMFLRDVREGIGKSGVRAGVVKVVTGKPGITEDVARILSAAADLHRETGVPVSTHSDPHTRTGLDQARYLLERGVHPDRMVIGHSGEADDLDYLLELLDQGVTLGFDRFGMAHVGQDESRLDTLLALLGRGFAAQLVLSQDSAVFSRVTPPSWRRRHAPDWSPDHLSRRILPQLRSRGVSQEDLDTMMISNPRRLLTALPAGGLG